MRYTTGVGELLDAICKKHYQGQIDALPQVLEANLGLAKHGPTLPTGLVLELPVLAPVAEIAAINLWD